MPNITPVPTYEYLCDACGYAFELVQAFSDAPVSECPQCKGNVRKVYSNVGIVFKGSGFYKTDSRGKSESATTSTASTPATPAKTESKTESKTETPKPAKKSESSSN